MISLVVVCYGRADLTRNLLASIDENTRLPFELVMVDNDSPDDSAELIAEYADKAVFLTENLGYARGADIGAIAASGDLICFLNTDTEVHAGWLEPLVEAFDDKSVGMAAGRFENPDGSLQHAGVHTFYEGNTLVAANITEERPSGESLVALAVGMVRRSALEQVGFHDHGFYNGYEDVDLALKMRAAGWKIRYCSESSIMHHCHASGPERWARVRENVRLLNTKWAGKV